jgi:bifunctional UDP-N-acetylglucosamine pyrophosphorylase/glucosamine-1-phosphate N-acetyltransferase
MDTSIIILAAGKGTRMKSNVPKVLHKLSGKQMLYYSIKEAQKISDDITVVLYHQADKVKSDMLKYFDNINYHIQDHENYPGTGGAVMGIETKYPKTLVLNGDMPLVEAEELKRFSEYDSDIVMSVLELDNPSGYGRVVIEDNQVQKIVEEKDATEDIKKINSVNAGVYLFNSELLKEYLPKLSNDNAQKEYYLTDIVGISRDNNKNITPLVVSEENFKGVNSKVDLANAEVIMQKRIKNRFMSDGVIMRLPDTIYIEEGVEIEGESIIDNGVSLLSGTKISSSHIKTNSVIEDSIIESSSIGPMARIRPKSVIKNSHIGNFCETKKSTLVGAKAGHLSYIGDAFIDEGTNVGAGVITCNYDGINKHQTIIGKNVFIGSDTQLIAPITIEDDVIIGAGSSLSKDVKSGDLVITRAPLKRLAGYFYKFFKKDN